MTTGRAYKTFACVLATICLANACAVDDVSAPSLTGPSEMALSLAVTATPDVIQENGAAQSTIAVVARDPNGQPVPNVQLRVETVNSVGAIAQVGTLSTSSVSTDSNGRATVMFTAPFAAVPGVENTTLVRIRVTPVGTDFSNVQGHFVQIRLVPQTIVVVPGSPAPLFVFSPQAPLLGQLVTFDASASVDTDGTIVRYDWNWGDGETDEGMIENHDWSSRGTFNVKLTVTDNAGLQSFIIKQIVVN